MGGLPRSGNSLLSALLNQHPDIYTTTTSPFVEILWRCYGIWGETEYKGELSSVKMQEVKIPFLRDMTSAYFSNLTSKPIVIDKRRQWNGRANIEMYKEVYGVLPKIICPVRSVKEIVASYISLYDKNEVMESDRNLFGNKFERSYSQLKESWAIKYKDCFLLVEYDDLIEQTQSILDSIYSFIGVSSFENTLQGISSIEPEGNYGIPGLHSVYSTIKRSGIEVKDVLSEEQYSKFSNWDFWR